MRSFAGWESMRRRQTRADTQVAFDLVDAMHERGPRGFFEAYDRAGLADDAAKRADVFSHLALIVALMYRAGVRRAGPNPSEAFLDELTVFAATNDADPHMVARLLSLLRLQTDRVPGPPSGRADVVAAVTMCIGTLEWRLEHIRRPTTFRRQFRITAFIVRHNRGLRLPATYRASAM